MLMLIIQIKPNDRGLCNEAAEMLPFSLNFFFILKVYYECDFGNFECNPRFMLISASLSVSLLWQIHVDRNSIDWNVRFHWKPTLRRWIIKIFMERKLNVNEFVSFATMYKPNDIGIVNINSILRKHQRKCHSLCSAFRKKFSGFSYA